LDTEGRTRAKRGEEIPIYGRIVAIADVYDALLSKRPYKAPWEERRALDEIRLMSGGKFDPDLVEVFFEILPTIRQVTERYGYTGR
jgi:HD-GYP domain-containing protein (c-di-GMP phosphodiesterase class II)